ncbi:hypothetical protein MSG28_012298 [Choristoneura fumiferana]|uniref:Uncharacterized protein n=1 Tax=Choristoneura fumiferana TaxID=7141 RepID=A0ACC0KCU9_CHOFU|nr:hypothetical protein MSG28_012298 [Choristoneura fumiferana]
MGDSLDGSEGAPEAQNVVVVEFQDFANYLRRAATVLLPEDDIVPPALNASLDDKVNQDCIRKFISDPQVSSLYVQRFSSKEDDNEQPTEGEEEKEAVTYQISTEVHFTSPRVAAFVCIKRGAVIEADKSIHSQLRLINLSDGSPYETLHAFISKTMAPFFKSYVKESGRADRDGDKMAPSVEKKIAELEMGLLHLQQNIDIPEITLPVHPIVAAVIKRAADEGRKPRVADFGDKVEDSTFLNQLQNGVNRWIKEIQKVTKLDRDPSNGTALQEISFWLNLERALHRIQEKRESIEVALTLEILKYGKRFHATVSFDTDTGLKQALATVSDYNPLMKDFPINDLLSATELERIRLAVQQIFSHLRKIRSTKYPIQRGLRLVEAISRDLGQQLLKVLGTRRLMHIPFEDFEKVMTQCFEVFSCWDDEYEKLQGLLRDIVKKKRDEHLKMVWRVSPSHKRLQARMEHMRRFRRHHEQLRTVMLRVNLAYENVKEVDCLDISREGCDAWEAAVRRYEDRIAKNANEMFRIFSRFNALFVRPHIRGAIREYQTQLIQRVKDDIEALHEKFKVQYPQSKCSRLSLVRDLPPVAGSIIWAKQIDHQLTAYLKRVEDVLGKGWENHIEGQKLKADGDSFRLKLDTQEVFDDWARKVQQRNLGVSGRIFAIESVRARSSKTGTILKLKVNFLPEIITLYKEVRNLKNLGFSVRTYERTLEKIRDKASIIPLVAGLRRDVLNQVSEGMALVWESYKLDPYVQKLSEVVLLFQEKVEDLLAVEEQISVDARSLETCPYSAPSLAEILGRLQRAIDDLSLRQYSNLHLWVQRLDEEVEKSLAARLQAGVEAWTAALLGKSNELDLSMDTYSPAEPTHKPGGEPQIARVVHEVRITNQQMYLFPSLEEARFQLMRQMFAWQAVVTSQHRLQSTRYQVGVARAQTATYRNLLTKLPGGSAPLENAYDAIEQKTSQVREYVDEWLRKSRTTFDTSDTRREYGPVVIDFARVQSKVALKYDAWHKEVLGKFGALLGGEMVHFHGQLAKSRSQLEQQTIEAASTSDAVSLITYVQQLKREVLAWEKQVDVYREAQRILERQRFQFPPQWLHVDNIEGEWSAFNEIMRRKDSSIQTQVASLQQKIVAEDKAVETRTLEFLTEWERSKPTDGSTRPEDALARLQAMEARYTKLKDERDNVAKAKEALELHDTGSSVNNERMTVALEELQDLRGVWSSLSKIWTQIDDIREKPWLSVQPRKLRQQLEAMLNELKELPARLRMYDSYEYVRKLLQSYTKVNMLIVELKSDALKERHWRQLCRALKVDWSLSELTLGQVWDADLLHNEHTVKDVVSVAQGEMALEEFLKQVRESWQSYELDLINYQNKCKIIRGWDDLFNKVKEHINSVAAMKLSPYYKKLNRINALFDVWIDVQRRWVYLEGIFSGSADIKTLLPVETSRFQSISSEFLGLMKKVSKSPMVMDVLNIPGVQRSLERLADLLGKIQKALGEYLERERSSFPRFYFVGDEDLLEIIGNSKNIARLQKHFKKMFAGVAAIILNEDNTIINGIASREGEEVYFLSPVSTVENPKINSWLSMVEREMRVTLACRLKDAVGDVKQFKDGNVDPHKFIEWCDKYQAQIVVLAAQILWSEDVDAALTNGGGDGLKKVLSHVENMLNILADSVLQEQPPLRRRKLEHLINEFVHKRTVTRRLIASDVNSARSFEWLCEMRFYFDPRNNDVLQQLTIHMANAKFLYGFEYLGVQDRLVQTPLTDRCYLTMTQALEARLGGSPFGPAGTGKTESVKALGNQLGRFVLVFNCDETFDFQAMGRIFVGLCQVGAWGCFDEFNRLEERMLSAVSQQVQTIQEALKSHQEGDNTAKSITVELVGKQVRVSQDMAIFITMNPGYAGRSNLPDNLKKLFRSLAMTTPDRQLIAEVMLFSQGFRTAEKLACKIVPFFKLCDEQLSNQSHYDFGLRALKSVLVSAGNVKRDRIQKIKENLIERGTEVPDEASIAESLPEQDILIQSVCETMVPKLVAEDIPLLFSLLNDVFPNVGYTRAEMTGLKNEIRTVCAEEFLVCGEGDEQGSTWMDKINKRQWIIFDGDVDPEWVENLNSVLDDNKLLTLPNGERLSLPPNVRVMFEVQDLKYATLATVSRCGMVWFSQDVLTTEMIFENYLLRLRNIPLEDGEEDSFSIVMAAPTAGGDQNATENILSPALQTQRDVAMILQPLFFSDGLVVKCFERAVSLDHIMDFTRHRALSSLHSMLNRGVRNILGYNRQHPDFPITNEQLEAYVPKWLVYSLLWSFAGDAKLKDRNELGDFIRSASTMPLPNCGANQHIIDFEVSITGEWVPWSAKVPQIEVETHKVAAPDVVVPTLDTVRHEALLYTWLAEHKPLVLCGPPGSGKTMTLFSALRALPDMEVVGLNFSSATTPELLLKTFDHYCEYRKTPNGVVLAPVQLGKWLVLFCDEINLPDMDQYGTQRVISFLRQLLEHKGFYRASDHSWVHLERIQFVGACNPPTDPGRKPLSHRLLRHVPVIYVDYPGETSLEQIYGTFTRAMLRMQPALRGYAEPLTQAMVKLYLASQERFTQDMQPHYVPLDNLSVEGLVRLWAHEALRLFQDRLVEDVERQWTDENIDTVAMRFFPGINREQALARPILYSNWLSKDYVPVQRDQLREYVKARLKVLEHVLRIDRIFRQPQGHLLLIGVSGAGKTTLSRFVAWMNGLSIFQIKVHNKYTGADFDEDLRSVLRRAGCRDEKVAFILDESNVLDSGFLERMNTLLANGEVPGLFEGDEFAALMTQCKEGAQREGLMLDSNDELYKWFTGQVMRNLHVVFTMNPSSEGLKDRAATSPALFNRCVLNWFGDWSDGALFQVGKEFTTRMDLDSAEYVPPELFPAACGEVGARPAHRTAVVNACVYRADLEEQQLHLNVGLGKIAETVEQVEEMQKSLAVKSQELQAKNEAANAKLRQMVKDQQEAEKKKVESQEIQVALEKQTKEIEAKRRDVMADLAQVEPAVIEAQNAVRSIKKQQLVEVRSMANPPSVVKMALESICTLLGEKGDTWKGIRSAVMKDNFISTIVNFETENITLVCRFIIKLTTDSSLRSPRNVRLWVY